jgi:predicted Rossmann fold flavoprotein
MNNFDVIIIGAGAAGLMCAAETQKRGRRVLLLDRAEKVGQKIRISGGGRANFTNLHVSPADFLSNNPRFCVSALKRYSQYDFIALVEKYRISYYEKTLGQLFCDGSAQQIIDMLVTEAQGVTIRTAANLADVLKNKDRFSVNSNLGTFTGESLVIATGGPSIPKMGSSGFGYGIAKQFNLNVIEPRPGLVPLTFGADVLRQMDGLAGVSLKAAVKLGKISFTEALLFTHRGLSGPVILQISSYWREGDEITVNLLPDLDVFQILKSAKNQQPKKDVHTILAQILPKSLAHKVALWVSCKGRLAETSDKLLRQLSDQINAWKLIPTGTEGLRMAEVTVGGVDTKELSSKTMEVKSVSGLYFIGEAVDVTGHLGGFNFQWAWASGHASGQVV